MKILRKGESGVIPFRTGRFFSVDSKWYFSSREGIDHGPYNTKHDAEVNLDFFINSVVSLENSLRA